MLNFMSGCSVFGAFATFKSRRCPAMPPPVVAASEAAVDPRRADREQMHLDPLLLDWNLPATSTAEAVGVRPDTPNANQRRSAAASSNRAFSHSRRTVRSVTPKVWAISMSVSPTK